MSETTILTNDYATLKYHSEAGIVHHIFHKAIFGDEFRRILNTGLEIFKKYGASKWLSDDRGNSPLPDDDIAWSKIEWFPRVVQAGWKYWALVVPEDAQVRMNLVQVTDTYSAAGIRVMVFGNPGDAMAWLEKL
jgi:hypothetical protein